MDEDFDTASFDEAYDISDFGDDQAFSMDDRAPVTTMFGGGNYVDTGAGGGDSIASILNPGLGSGNRTNITNVGGGSNLVYDPAFAAALDISRGLDPTLNLGGTGGLAVPAALRPQIPGEFMTTPLGEADMVRPMFFSQGEKFLQQTLPEIVRSGPLARLARGIGSVFQEGINFAKDASGGIKLPSLQEIGQGFTNFMNRFTPQRTVTDTNAMNMPEAAIIRETYDYGDRPLVDVMGQNTFGSMPMNTGIAQVQPNMANQANMAVTDALQLIPQGTLADSIGVRNQVAQALDPDLKAFIDNQPSIDQRMRELEDDRMEREREDNFRREVLNSIQNRNTGLLNQDFINRSLNKEEFMDVGPFINLDNV